MNLAALTPAGIAYLGKQYEACVDRDMDVGSIYAYLTQRGVAVTRAEVIHHLDHVFKFTNYAAKHPALPLVSYEQADAAMRKPARRVSCTASNAGTSL